MTNYSDIEILPLSIYAFDIDNTIMFSEQIPPFWWSNRLNYYLLQNKTDANQLTMNDWNEMIEKHSTSAIDLIGFKNVCDQIRAVGSTMILLTAREECVREITLRQLESCGLDFISTDVIFFEKNKGRFLKQFCGTTFHNIVFIDDLVYNIDDVQHYIPNAICYLAKFIHPLEKLIF